MARDAPAVWGRMVANLRRADRACRRDLRILFDLAGPSCRTDEVALIDRARLQPGDRLLLTRGAPKADGRFPALAFCTVPGALDRLAPGQAMWFDDGKLQGEVEEVRGEGVLVRVLRTGPKGAKLESGNLPEIIVQAARWQPFGVMIARGDLALGIGFARLAEMQEELLWLCEAAHVPVVWATEVLENLRKTGMFARGEMTDAAMVARAECVMLNKGP